MGWNDLPSDKGGGGNWIKLKNNGDSISVVFTGEPTSYVKDFPPSQYGEGGPKTVWSIQCIDVSTMSGKVWEASARFFQSLKTVINEVGHKNQVFKVVRNGAAGNTATTYSFIPLRLLTEAEQLAAVNVTYPQVTGVTSGKAPEAAHRI